MHPNLSDEINANMAQSEKDGGLKLADVKDGQTFTVKTKNTLYVIKKDLSTHEIKEGGVDYFISGSERFCPTPIRARINGSTWGGSMISSGFVGIGMHLEAVLFGEKKTVLTTTPIETIELK